MMSEITLTWSDINGIFVDAGPEDDLKLVFTSDKVRALCSLALRGLDADDAHAEVERLQARVELLEKLDSEAATHVESVICMRTNFTGESPYVGWKGLGLALNEALDELDKLKGRLT
jgi:hypothetical protein